MVRIGKPAWPGSPGSVLVAGGVIWLAIGAVHAYGAAASRTLDMTYDATMDMVRPETHPGIIVHHNLHVEISDRGVVEGRDRSYRDQSDTDAMEQRAGKESGTYVSWRADSPTRLVRTERDMQSTRTMVVTLTQTSCHLDVTDALDPGFKEFKFLRIGHNGMAYFSSYRVVSTTCSVR